MSNEPLTRATLLLKIRDPCDQESWRQFVDIYAPIVHQCAVRRGLQDPDAFDVVQDVMRKISQSIKRFEYDRSLGKFRAWLHTLTKNQIVSHQRKNAKHLGSGDSNVQELLNNHAEPDDDDWEKSVQLQIFQVALQQAQSEFSAVNWQAFYQTAVQQVPASEVATKLDMKVGTVYVAKSRVVARMREIVHDIGGDW